VSVTTTDFESSVEESTQDTRHRDTADSGGDSSLGGAEEQALSRHTVTARDGLNEQAMQSAFSISERTDCSSQCSCKVLVRHCLERPWVGACGGTWVLLNRSPC
jgi:hypothetical protein